jgi:YD repeat-containing protein
LRKLWKELRRSVAAINVGAGHCVAAAMLSAASSPVVAIKETRLAKRLLGLFRRPAVWPIALTAVSALANAQEGISQVTLTVDPALYWVSWNYPMSPTSRTCSTAIECLEADLASVAARNPQITYTLVNVRPHDGVGTINGVIRAYIADYRSDWVDSSGVPRSSVQANVGATSLEVSCPADGRYWQLVTVSPQPDYVYRCERVVTQPQQPCDACPRAEVGNPIALATGEKIQRTEDYRDASGWLNIRRLQTTSADSLNGGLSFGHVASLLDMRESTALKGCYPSYYIELDTSTGTAVNKYVPFCYEYTKIVPSFNGVYVYIDNSQRLVFGGTGNAPASLDQLGELSITGSGASTVYFLKRKHFPGIEIFDAAGRMSRRVHMTGRGLSYGYTDIALASGGHFRALTSITDDSGRQLALGYGPTNELVTITDPAGLTVRYVYGEANETCRSPGFCRQLTSAIYQDQSRRRYHYDEPLHMAGDTNSYGRLTGITDENGRRHASFSFGASGRAVATEHGGGVNRFSVAYTTDSAGHIVRADVTEPLGGLRATHFTSPAMTSFVSSQSQPAGSGAAAASAQWVYDANGNLVRRDDLNGKRTCYANDIARNLQTVRVEGLVIGADCDPVTASNSVLPLGRRKTSTQWHPDWRLETRVAEPGRIVTSVYNGQPDPFNGNAVASCAPASALLPDGKPIAVLCKRVEQATTDTNGAAGFSAVLQSGVAARTTTWTYNQWGQVLSENGPRVDVNDTTTYTYYSDTSFTGEGAAATGHFMGDLATVTNATGRVTQYTKYNKHGQVLESIDPNGVVTTNTYDLRQRLLSTTVGNRTTTYQYDPVGQLKRVTLPDQSWVGYDYDDAHRQIAVYDHKGNRVDYTLDNAGNRIAEQTKDLSGALKRQLSRSIDALGRVQKTTGREWER